MNNITKLASLLFIGGVVTSSGIQKRVLVSTPNFGAWYRIEAKHENHKLNAVTVRREDSTLEHTLTDLEAPRWIHHLQEVGA